MAVDPDRPGDRPVIVAFLASEHGAGRTGVVADLAWNLANAGRRVLVIDWGSATPGVSEYLQPFEIGNVPLADESSHPLATAGSGVLLGRENTRLSQYAVPSERGDLHVVGPDGAEYPTGSPLHVGGPIEPDDGTMAGLRADLAHVPYDAVLIDWPTSDTDASAAKVALVSDVAVVCFRPQPRLIGSSAELARSLRRHGPGLRLAAVAIQFDRNLAQTIERTVDESFADLLATAGPRGRMPGLEIVKIPYQPFGALGEVLPTLVATGESWAALQSAFSHLTAVVTEGGLAQLPPVPNFVRNAYRRGIDPDGATDEGETVLLAYLPEERAWADWLHGRLSQAGVNVALRSPRNTVTEPSAAMVLIVLSRQSATSAAGHDLLTAVSGPAVGDPVSGRRAVVVRVGEAPDEDGAEADLKERSADRLSVQTIVPAATWIDVTDRSEAGAWGDIRARLGLIDSSRGRAGSIALPRYSAFPALGGIRYQNLPPRNEDFVGRVDDLEDLRDRLLAAAPPRRIALVGEAGVGKSEIALEYAHRFVHDYSIVWWIPAEDRYSVRRSLTDLGEELGVDVAGDPVAAVLAALADRPTRWLLVFDNADAAGDLKQLVPDGGPGHIVLTSRPSEQPGAQPGSAVVTTVDTLAEQESIALLRRRVAGLTREDAARLAELSALPLTLSLTASWITEHFDRMSRTGHSRWQSGTTSAVVNEFLYWRQVELDRLATQAPKDGPVRRATAAAVVSMVIRTLDGSLWENPAALPDDTVTRADLRDIVSPEERRIGWLTVRLAEMCAFLSPDGVTLRLLRSASMIAQLAVPVDVAAGEQPGAGGEFLLDDSAELDRALWRGARSGLFEVDWWRSPSMRMHRVVRAAIADRLAEIDGGKDYDSRWKQVLAGLAGFAPTDAETNLRERQGDFRELQRHFYTSNAIYGRDPAVHQWVVRQFRYLYTEGDPVTAEMALEQANAALESWRELGVPASRITRLKVEIANLHRVLGAHEAAYAIDQEALAEQMKDPERRGHPRTLIIRRGLADDLRDLGRFEEARDRDAATFRGLQTEYGDDHPDTMRAANNLAWSEFLYGDVPAALALGEPLQHRLLRLGGRREWLTWWTKMLVGIYHRELGHYELAAQVLREAADGMGSIRPAGHPDLLRIARASAVTDRRQQNYRESTAVDSHLLQTYRSTLGELHSATRACRLSLAADYNAMHDEAKAVDEAEACLRDYLQASGPDHPFTNLCRVNLAAFYRSAGKAVRGLETIELGRDKLREALGPYHPWTLGAAINHANILVAVGRIAEAQALIGITHEDCHEYLLADHPYTRTAGHNHDLLSQSSERNGTRPTEHPEDIDIDVPQN